jgi:hypothetical protein
MYYVTMTDRFLSGWGRADRKTNKLVIACSTYAEAIIVAENAERRGEMKYVNIRSTKPSYPASRYMTSFKDINDYAAWRTPQPTWK